LTQEHFEIAQPAEVGRLLAQARRVETACGDGSIVWHTWGSGRPLVLLHGGSGSWNHWVRNIAALAHAGHLVCVPDLPGFGDSANPPGGHDADAIVAPLTDGLRALLGSRPCDLVGFSFGSIVASFVAAQAPQLVRQLVVMGAPVLPLRSGKGVTLAPWRHLSTQALRNAVHRENLLALMLHRPDSAGELAVALHAMNVPRDRMRRRRLVTTDAMARALARVSCPVQAIYGEVDVLYRDSWADVVAALQGLPAFRELLLVPGAGHWVQFEEPEAVNAALVRMVAG
jgi:2-hydroxy-6-oxonona-2,4-dienedioate hydrolase